MDREILIPIRCVDASAQLGIHSCSFGLTNCYTKSWNEPANSVTRNLNPTDQFWTTVANGTPATVPNGPQDIATFRGESVLD